MSAGSDWYIHDVGIGGMWTLLCSYAEGETRWAVADISWAGGEPRLADQSSWTEVEQTFVAKVSTAHALRHREDVSLEEKLAAVLGPENPPGNQPGCPALAPSDTDLELAVTKATDEKRYTFGPLYAPDRLDAHGEYVDADTLQESVWEYVRASRKQDGAIKLMHGDYGESLVVGEWVDVVSWPQETEVELAVPGTDEVKKVTLPPNTVYMGVVWTQEAWPLVKAGKLAGLSMGGRAVRVRGESSAPTEKMGGS